MSDGGRRPLIAIFTLGGTIAATTDHGDSGGVSPRLGGTELVDAVPGLDSFARLEVVEFRQVPSGDLDLSDVISLARAIDLRFADGVDGVVVTQGTDTLEETAFALDLLVR